MVRIETTIEHVRRFVRPQALGSLPDRELLDRFAKQRDPEAFAALVERHGKWVHGVCRRSLGHAQDAEDAFQAVFLILARKAGLVAQPDALGPWLFGVARRVARNLKRSATTREQRERQADSRQTTYPRDEIHWREVREVLDEELLRLPPRYQAPLFLCHWQGRTQEQGARQLGWSFGTFKGRLDRGRERLRRRLEQRGLAESGVFGTALLSQGASGPAISELLRQAVLQAGIRSAEGAPIGACGIYPQVTALAAEAIRAITRPMLWPLIGSMVLMLGVVLGSALAWTGLMEEPVSSPPPSSQPAEADKPERPFVRTQPSGDLLPPEARARLGKAQGIKGEPHEPIAFSPNGKALTSAGSPTVRLFDLASGKQTHALEGHQAQVRAVAFTPDGKSLASAGDDGSVRFWNVVSGKETLTLDKHSVPIFSIAFSSDGKTLASGDGDGTVRLWDVVRRKEILAIEASSRVLSVAFAPDSKIIASAGFGGTVRLWDVTSGKPVCVFGRDETPGERIFSVAFAPDGKSIAAAGGDGMVRLWDVVTGKQIHALDNQYRGSSQSASFTPDGKSLASVSANNTLRLWDVTGGKLIHAFASDCRACSVAFAPDGKFLASANEDGTLLVWAADRYRSRAADTLMPDDIPAVWDQATNTDAGQAWRAIGALVASRQSVAFLRDRVKPVAAPAPEHLQQLLTDLGSRQFAVREKAGEALGQLEDLAAPALRQVLEGNPSLDLRQRVEVLLEQPRTWSGDRLRLWRAIQVLEGIGSPEAQEVLEKLAQGAPESQLTREAQASLRRLAAAAAIGK